MQPRLTLHVFRSPTGVDWSSPRRLALSVLRNKLFRYVNGNRRFLGHTAIELHGNGRKVVAGVACRNGETADAVINGKSGFGVLFGVYPGRLETEHELLAEIAAKRNTGLVHSITYLLSEEAAATMADHYDRYRAAGGFHNYGFPLDTLSGEGGGCSAFALSFLQVAGLADPAHFGAWSGSVWVPERLIGPHNTQRYELGDQPLHEPDVKQAPITILSVLLDRKNARWAQPGFADTRCLAYYDPDTMFRWIEAMAAEKDSGSAFEIRRHQRSLDLVFDYRSREAVPGSGHPVPAGALEAACAGMNPWRALLLLGPTGAGKTPLGSLLERTGLAGRRCMHFDFGAHLRRVVTEARAALACGLTREEQRTVGQLLESGRLLERDTFSIALKVLDGFVATRKPCGDSVLVMNGLPRHREQAHLLRPRLRVEHVVWLDCTPEAALRRIRSNRGGDRAQRADDHPSAIRERLERYRARTMPLVEYYKRLGARVTRVSVTEHSTAEDLLPQLRHI